MEHLLDRWLWEAFHILEDYLKFATGAFILFYFLLKRPLWFRKIQQKMPKMSDYLRDFLFSFLSITIFATVTITTLTILRPYTNVYNDIHEYGTAYYIFTWIWMLLLHDTWFYWSHRLMHHPKVFKYVHLVHHKSTNPSPWTAYAFHPLEALIQIGIFPLIAFTLPVHIGAISWFFLFQIVYNVYEHLGFELYPKGFHKTWIGRLVITSVSHNLHHKRFTGNFGLYFLFWDRAMGTMREDYDRMYEEATERPFGGFGGDKGSKEKVGMGYGE